MAKLTSAKRKGLPAVAFAVDGKLRKYPIPDRRHAINALARVRAHGTPAERKEVEDAVCKKYPDLPFCIKRKGIKGSIEAATRE